MTRVCASGIGKLTENVVSWRVHVYTCVDVLLGKKKNGASVLQGPKQSHGCMQLVFGKREYLATISVSLFIILISEESEAKQEPTCTYMPITSKREVILLFENEALGD